MPKQCPIYTIAGIASPRRMASRKNRAIIGRTRLSDQGGILGPCRDIVWRRRPDCRWRRTELPHRAARDDVARMSKASASTLPCWQYLVRLIIDGTARLHYQRAILRAACSYVFSVNAKREATRP